MGREYNKALRQAKRESGRSYCEEIEKAPECARFHRILSKDEQSVMSSIQLENGDYINTEKDTGGAIPGPLPWFRNYTGTFWRLGRS
jgi:hypothetical protein